MPLGKVGIIRDGGIIVRNENSAQSFSDRSLWKSLRVVDVRAPSGHGCPCLHACFSRILSTLTEVLGRGIRANEPRMSAGYPSQKLPLWADFFVLDIEEGQLHGHCGRKLLFSTDVTTTQSLAKRLLSSNRSLPWKYNAWARP